MTEDEALALEDNFILPFAKEAERHFRTDPNDCLDLMDELQSLCIDMFLLDLSPRDQNNLQQLCFIDNLVQGLLMHLLRERGIVSEGYLLAFNTAAQREAYNLLSQKAPPPLPNGAVDVNHILENI